MGLLGVIFSDMFVLASKPYSSINYEDGLQPPLLLSGGKHTVTKTKYQDAIVDSLEAFKDQIESFYGRLPPKMKMLFGEANEKDGHCNPQKGGCLRGFNDDATPPGFPLQVSPEGAEARLLTCGDAGAGDVVLVLLFLF